MRECVVLLFFFCGFVHVRAHACITRCRELLQRRCGLTPSVSVKAETVLGSRNADHPVNCDCRLTSYRKLCRTVALNGGVWATEKGWLLISPLGNCSHSSSLVTGAECPRHQ